MPISTHMLATGQGLLCNDAIHPKKKNLLQPQKQCTDQSWAPCVVNGKAKISCNLELHQPFFKIIQRIN